jgi:hypothetical protein
MIRTVSFNELGSIVAPHPHNDFYSNTQFGMYPLNLPKNIRGMHSHSGLISPLLSGRNSQELSSSDAKTLHHSTTNESDDSEEFYSDSASNRDEDSTNATEDDDKLSEEDDNQSQQHTSAQELDEHGKKLNDILSKEYTSHKKGIVFFL